MGQKLLSTDNTKIKKCCLHSPHRLKNRGRETKRERKIERTETERQNEIRGKWSNGIQCC